MNLAEWATPAIFIAVAGWVYKLQRDQAEIRVNYLDRFADLKAEVTNGHGEIKDAIADLREHLASNYVSKADCPQLHKQ